MFIFIYFHKKTKEYQMKSYFTSLFTNNISPFFKGMRIEYGIHSTLISVQFPISSNSTKKKSEKKIVIEIAAKNINLVIDRRHDDSHRRWLYSNIMLCENVSMCLSVCLMHSNLFNYRSSLWQNSKHRMTSMKSWAWSFWTLLSWSR